jgi:cytochrome c oxidase cbb3-type subunit I/II
MTTGLSGTPMPSYRDPLSEEDRWALSYYVLALSAYKDPLSGEPLPIAPSDRRALNDPALEAGTPDKAYVPSGRAASRARVLAGRSGNGAAEQRAAKE